MRIARDGTWYYHGSPIGRKEMVRLFASVLNRREDGSYWLGTPVEEGTIEVEDAPFVTTALSIEGEGEAANLAFTTNVDDEVPLDEAHPLRVAEGEQGPMPYVLVRDGLEAKISRSIYYELAERAVEQGHRIGVWSHGRFFPLEPS